MAIKVNRTVVSACLFWVFIMCTTIAFCQLKLIENGRDNSSDHKAIEAAHHRYVRYLSSLCYFVSGSLLTLFLPPRSNVLQENQAEEDLEGITHKGDLVSNPITASRGLPHASQQSRPVQVVRCEGPTCDTFNINVEANRGLFYATDEQSKLVQMVRWEAPPCGTFKINVDGSFIIKSREAGIGGLIRNSNGQWIFGFSEPVKVEIVLHAELLAIKRGLELAWNVGCRNVICETDSTYSLKLIKWASTNVHIFREVIGEIRKICKRKWERVELVHVLREGNQCADYLAKFGSRHPYHCLWMFPLYTLVKQLEDDARGTFYIRRKL